MQFSFMERWSKRQLVRHAHGLHMSDLYVVFWPESTAVSTTVQRTTSDFSIAMTKSPNIDDQRGMLYFSSWLQKAHSIIVNKFSLHH